MSSFINKIKQKISSKKYFFMIFFILIIYYFLFLERIENINVHNFNFYIVSYEYGFISRGFIGTILRFFFTYLSISNIYLILNIIFISFLAFLAYLSSQLINKIKNKSLAFLIILLCIFTPASFMLMITMNEFGRLDIFLFINSIIMIILIYKNKFLYLIPLLFVISMFTHQNFLFMYAPLILMLLLYNWFKNKEKKWLIYFIVSLICLVLSLGIVLKFGKPDKFATTEEFAAVLQQRTDVPIRTESPSQIKSEYYRPLSEHIEKAKMYFNNTPKRRFLIGFLLIISYLYIQYFLCYKYLKKKYKILPLMIFACFGSIPLFLVGIDFGRWYLAIINAFVLLFGYLIFDNIGIINDNLKKIEKKINLLLMMAIFYILIIPSSVFTFMEFSKIENIIERIKNFIDIIFN